MRARNSRAFLLYHAQHVVSIGMLGILAAAAAGSLRWARADEAARAGDFTRALELVPANTAYLAAAAAQVEAEGGEAEAALARIAALNPTVAAPRIRLGLAAEARGDAAAAERWLLEAFAVDRQFEPRWTLANFYLRQGRLDEFYKWMRMAGEFSYGDRTALFDLCWRASGHPQTILAECLPAREAVTGDFLRYVIDRRYWDAILPAARRVEDTRLLLDAVDLLLESRRFADAADLWVRAGRQRPHGITAPRFEAPQSHRGFDWRLASEPGVTVAQRASGHGLRIQFSGRQPESVQLLAQYCGGLRPGARYRLDWTAEGQVPAGLEWRFDGIPVNGPFRVAEAGGVLTLHYRRPVGEVRAEGTFDLHEVRLSALE